MKQYVVNNTRHNKAAYILASMSPDMVEDIISLVNQRGRSLVNDLFDGDDGPPRPLSMMSREYIPDTTFPAVYVGLMTMVLSQMRTLRQDFDFYEKTLMNAFSIPQEIASSIAKNIETYDVLGGSAAAKDRLSWFNKLNMQFQEGIRRLANTPGRVFGLGIENDQTQDYDIDFLYELKLLGEAVSNLADRAALMRGQAAIAAQMGVFRAADGTNPSGDVYGDIYGDPVDIAEIQLMEAAKPLMGAPLPLAIFGGLRNLFKAAKKASESKLDSQLSAAGAAPGTASKDVALATAYDRLTDENKAKLALINSPNVTAKTLGTALELIKVARATGESGDVYEEVCEQYGDAAAEQWAKGNVPALMTEVIDMAGDAMLTTGDRELDEAIIGDVLSDLDVAFGDVESDTDKELGGIFTRARINRQIKKGRRRQRKNARRTAKQNRKDAKVRALNSARQWANDQYQPMPQQFNPYEGEDFEGDDAANIQYSNDGADNPDDVYNVDQYFETPAMD